MQSYKCLTDEPPDMVDVTLFELHLRESSFNAPFSGGRRKRVEAGDEPVEAESSSSKGKLVGALVGLVFLAAVAFVVRKKVLGGDDADEEEVELSSVTA